MERMHSEYRLVSITIGIFMACSTLAQSTFLKVYENGDQGFSVRGSGAGYTVAGGTDFYFNWHWQMLSDAMTSDVHLFQTDADGILQWEKAFHLAGHRTLARWMEPTLDGGYILTGISSNDLIWPPDSNDVILIRTDANGQLLWAQKFDSGKDELGYCVRHTTDGGFIIAGFHDSMPISPVGNTHILLIKTDAVGQPQWQQTISLAVRDLMTLEPFPYVVRQLSDGGFAIVGTSLGSLALGVYVVRTNAMGQVTWANVYEHDASVLRFSTGLDILETVSGNLLVAGSMDKSRPNEVNYPYVLNLDPGGALLDARFYETVPLLFWQSGFSSVESLGNGDHLFTGMGGYGGFGDQAQILRVDSTLNMEWSRVYTWDGNATMGARSGKPTADGGFVFTGKRQFQGTALLKTNEVGLIPCKNPNILQELLPSIQVLNVTPTVNPVSWDAPIVMTDVPLGIDTATACPTTVSTLPIELIQFGATMLSSGKVLVEWHTASEPDNDYFVLERSLDGETFQEVENIRAAGSGSVGADYSYIDDALLLVPVTYYRLLQVDDDGASSYSDIIAVNLSSNGLHILDVRYDDMARNWELIIYSDRASKLVMTMYDMTGRILVDEQLNVTAGRQRVLLRPPSRGAGMYSVLIAGAGRKVSTNLVWH